MKTLRILPLVCLLLTACQDIPAPESTTQYPAFALGQNNELELFFGPVQFVRGKGKPVTETVAITSPDFEHFMDPFVLRLRNGNEDGTSRISSATVVLDGQQVFGPSDFSQQVAELHAPVTVTATSELSVRLASKPNRHLTIWIEGKLKPGRARVGAEGGLVVSEDGNAELRVPSGALVQSIILSVEPVSVVPPGLGFIEGAVYEFGPDGTTFTTLVELTISYNEANLPAGLNELSLVMLRTEDGTRLRRVVDQEANRVTAFIDGFSGHGVALPPASPLDGVDPSTVGKDPSTGTGAKLDLDAIDWTDPPAFVEVSKTLTNNQEDANGLYIWGACTGGPQGGTFFLFQGPETPVVVTFSDGESAFPAHAFWTVGLPDLGGNPEFGVGETVTLTETIALGPGTPLFGGFGFHCRIEFSVTPSFKPIGVQDIFIGVPPPSVFPPIIERVMQPGEVATVDKTITRVDLPPIGGIPASEVGRIGGPIAFYDVLAIFPQDPVDPFTPLGPVIGGAGCTQFFSQMQWELTAQPAIVPGMWHRLKDLDPPLNILGTNIENVWIFSGATLDVLLRTHFTEKITADPQAVPGDYRCVFNFWVAIYAIHPAFPGDPGLDPARFFGRQEIRITIQ